MPVSHETPLIFDCAGEQLLGILHQPAQAGATLGVLLVVGGPQYRVGSHRQFVLLARELAGAGIPVFRFDYRGMGDSSGEARDFETVHDDIRCAIERYQQALPTLHRIVLWGLCDAASANAFYARHDERVVGQIALNPWARTGEGEAQAFIRHYYLRRLFSGAFWRKVFGLEFDARHALRDFFAKYRASRGRRAGQSDAASDRRPLPLRLQQAQTGFAGPTLLILSGQDLTAKEYEMCVADAPEWLDWRQSSQVTVQRLPDADHTFSRVVWRDQVADWSRDWIRQQFAGD